MDITTSKTIIYELLCDYIDDPEKVSEVYDKISDLESDIKNNYKSEVKEIKGQIVILNNQIATLNTHITDLEEKLDLEEKQNLLLKKSIRHFSLFRASLNKIINIYSDKYKNEIIGIDYSTFSYKKRMVDSDGFKYALARINGYSHGLSKELCQLYLDMNDSFHPRLTPIKVVFDSIMIMKELIHTNSMPDYYIKMGLNETILNEFESIVQSNAQLF
jgi:hypothetical protein